jgi:hypothetical protein
VVGDLRTDRAHVAVAGNELVPDDGVHRERGRGRRDPDDPLRVRLEPDGLVSANDPELGLVVLHHDRAELDVDRRPREPLPGEDDS